MFNTEMLFTIWTSKWHIGLVAAVGTFHLFRVPIILVNFVANMLADLVDNIAGFISFSMLNTLL
jgi:hypothetical protein